MKTLQTLEVIPDNSPKNKLTAAETCLWRPDLECFLATALVFTNYVANSRRNNFLPFRMLLKQEDSPTHKQQSVDSSNVHHLQEKPKRPPICPPYAWVLFCHLVSYLRSIFFLAVMQDYIRFTILPTQPYHCHKSLWIAGSQFSFFFGTYETRAVLSANLDILEYSSFLECGRNSCGFSRLLQRMAPEWLWLFEQFFSQC